MDADTDTNMDMDMDNLNVFFIQKLRVSIEILKIK
jgi:hypothetical protein